MEEEKGQGLEVAVAESETRRTRRRGKNEVVIIIFYLLINLFFLSYIFCWKSKIVTTENKIFFERFEK